MTNILTTKLYVPARVPGLIDRPHLIERLNAGLRKRLILVSAPAGFGKTTLVSDWLRQLAIPAAWLSLDANDDDLSSLLSYMITALQQIAPDIGQSAQEILQSPQPLSHEPVLTSLINDIVACASPFVFVLDDYHFMRQPALQAACAFLIEHMPPAMHLVIITREDPPLPLGRLRSRQQVAEIRASDLRLTPQETTLFLDAMGLDLSADDVATLAARTEGWITGLHLVALSLRAQENKHDLVITFAGDDRYVADYLVSEVLARQPAVVQQFLLSTSILDRFCSGLCDAVLDGESRRQTASQPCLSLSPQSLPQVLAPGNSQAILEYLERVNLFIVPLDNRREWYRYHHLFADLLCHRLRRLGVSWVGELHRRAAMWYKQQGLVDEALRHLLAAGEFTQAALLIEHQGITIFWQQGHISTLSRWLRQFPPEHMQAHPRLCLLAAWVRYIVGCYDEIEPFLGTTETHWQACDEAGLQSLGAAEHLELHVMRGEVALLRAFVASLRGSITPAATAFESVQRALELLPDHEHQQRGPLAGGLAEISYLMGDVVTAKRLCTEVLTRAQLARQDLLALLCMSRLTDIHIIQGQLHEAAQLCKQMRALAAKPGRQHLLTGAWADVMLSRILYEWNDFDTALRLLHHAIERGRQTAMYRIVVEGLITLARILHAQHETMGAWAAIQEALQITQSYHVLQDWGRLSGETCRVQFWIRQDHLDAAMRWSWEHVWSATTASGYQHELNALTRVHMLIARGAADQALELLDCVQQGAEQGERWGRVIEALALRALALQMQGRTEAALPALKKALTLAEPQGYVRLFVDKGAPMARLLTRLKDDPGPSRDYIRILLAACSSSTHANQSVPQLFPWSDVQSLIEPLSDREMEILHLLAAGLSNRDIAHRLVLSSGTVKVHISHIYRKLDVRSRTQAMAKAQTLGILASP